MFFFFPNFLSINGSDYIKIGPLKIIGDGPLGARTAFLGAPCADKPDARRIPVFSQDQLDEMISYANSHSMQGYFGFMHRQGGGGGPQGRLVLSWDGPLPIPE